MCRAMRPATPRCPGPWCPPFQCAGFSEGMAARQTRARKRQGLWVCGPKTTEKGHTSTQVSHPEGYRARSRTCDGCESRGSPVRQERARRKCLERWLFELSERGVRQVLMDSRGRKLTTVTQTSWKLCVVPGVSLLDFGWIWLVLSKSRC